MNIKDLTAALEREKVVDIAVLNEKMDELLDAEQEKSAVEGAHAPDPAPEETGKDPEVPAAETETAEKEPEEAPEEETKGLSAIGAVIEKLTAENAELKAELDAVKSELSAKNKAEQEFIAKFKNLSVSLATERVAETVEESTTDVVTDGIGEI